MYKSAWNMYNDCINGYFQLSVKKNQDNKPMPVFMRLFIKCEIDAASTYDVKSHTWYDWISSKITHPDLFGEEDPNLSNAFIGNGTFLNMTHFELVSQWTMYKCTQNIDQYYACRLTHFISIKYFKPK